jgi:hypothetical protein
MNPVEVNRMRVRAGVDEFDADAITLHAAQAGAGDAAIVDPGWEEDSWSDFDLFIDRRDVVFPQGLPVRQRAHPAEVPLGEQHMRIETIRLVVYPANGSRRSMCIVI